MKANPTAMPKKGAPGASNPRKGREMETPMMGKNPAQSHKQGAPGASNPRKGTVVMPESTKGAIQGKPKAMGNPGSSNPRKGVMMKTPVYTGQ